MSKYWFKPKWFGYGFYPVSVEGWLATLGLIGLIVLSGLINNVFVEPGPSKSEAARFILDSVMLAGLSCLFFEKKMKEPLKWRWGK